MNNLLRNGSLNSSILRLIVIVLLASLSGVAHSEFTQIVTFTDDQSDFYVTVPADNTTKMGVDNRDIIVPIETSAKIEFVIPPGTDQFYLTAQEVSSWSGQQGDIKYAVSLDNYADAGDYPLATSTGLTVIFLYSQTGQGALTTEVSDQPRKGYLIVKNDSGQPWKSFYINVSMRVSNSTIYNKWVNDGCIVPELLIAPKSLTSGTITTDSVTLSWINVDANAEYNRIKRGGITIDEGLPSTQTTYTDSGLTEATNYSYEVCAYKGSEESCSDALWVRTKSTQVSTDITPILFLLE